MDQLSTSIGISCLANRQPNSLIEWNAQYEAMSVEQDWWFKAGVALANWVRSAIVSMSGALTAGQASTIPALRAAHA